MEDPLDQEWAVAEHDRGHGHKSYAVVVKENDMLVVETGTWAGIADHIVDVHNDWLKEGGNA